MERRAPRPSESSGFLAERGKNKECKRGASGFFRSAGSSAGFSSGAPCLLRATMAPFINVNSMITVLIPYRPSALRQLTHCYLWSICHIHCDVIKALLWKQKSFHNPASPKQKVFSPKKFFWGKILPFGQRRKAQLLHIS